ncbi:LytR/AlgR family response regulator transcription factor [Neolewinella persica]|uniref:LytR/AlgR family response regulator transcription factor n=1 Tax=Neolewinella persica TaxID=70998 RepID=UPI000378F3FF|nr:LytTR family DNA-binding domain-containing protein [Neolewinella persica]
MLSALLLDDEPDALEVLDLLLQRHCPSVIRRDCFVTPLGARKAIDQHDYDLAFLDIQLQRSIDGLQFAEAFKDTKTRVVFTTAHQRFALAAFKARAFDYLLKPISTTELKRVVAEVSLQRPKTDSPTLLLSDLNRSVRIAEKDIVFVAGSGSYCRVYDAAGEVIELSHNLSTFQSRLASNYFFRCHQSFLVNLSHCREVVSQNRQFSVILTKNQIALVSRNRKKELLTLLETK